ncbi:MAG: hypothetical protein Q8P77_03480 [Candidatus Veblenbacteria bacterium]|nr:hypothetical protein [Candidatus Veblenbacteria bacterium]
MLPFLLGGNLTAQTNPSQNYGWLPPGESWFEFNHRVANTGPSARLIDDYFRGEFVFGWWKPIYKWETCELDALMIPYLMFGGFHDRRIFLPAFSFRGELTFRYFLSPGFELRLSNLHYSNHLMDRPTINTLAKATELSRVNITVDDINLIRLGVALSRQYGLWQVQTDVGLQPIRLNYWLITEPNRLVRNDSYGSYERPIYFNISLNRTLGPHRLTLRYQGEFSSTLRSIVELTYSTVLNTAQPWADGLQVFLSYEGGNIANNELAITPHNGISRDWLRLGFRIFN